MTKFLIAILALTSFYSNADILRELKSTPATKYDIMSLNLDIGSTWMKQQLEQKYKDSNSPIKIHDVKALLDREIGIKMSFTAPTKKLTPEFCSELTAKIPNSFNQPDQLRGLVSGLSEEQYKQLAEVLVFKLELVSADNTALKYPCN